MAPARTSTRRTQRDQDASTRLTVPDISNGTIDEELFLEPMMGTPLAIYIEKDVHDRDVLVDLIIVSGSERPQSPISCRRVSLGHPEP